MLYGRAIRYTGALLSMSQKMHSPSRLAALSLAVCAVALSACSESSPADRNTAATLPVIAGDVATQFRTMGLRPGNDASFYQTVPFKAASIVPGSRSLSNDFMKNHYHGASDDSKLRFDSDSAGRVATANFMIALEIANAPQRPRWQKDDFFANLYGTELTRTK